MTKFINKPVFNAYVVIYLFISNIHDNYLDKNRKLVDVNAHL